MTVCFSKKLIGSFLATFYPRRLLSFDYNVLPYNEYNIPSPLLPSHTPSRFLLEMKSVIVFQKSLKYSLDYKQGAPAGPSDTLNLITHY